SANPCLSYPYITSRSDMAGGVPTIEGTRVTVRTIAAYHQVGMTVDEILDCLPYLRHSQVHSALAYYFDHQSEIDADLLDATDEATSRAGTRPHPNAS
ncbi:MAG TPA: DUF433 domain-containing protein, partial [Trueperaceae bacterium]